jgi:hypothetical protein
MIMLRNDSRALRDGFSMIRLRLYKHARAMHAMHAIIITINKPASPTPPSFHCHRLQPRWLDVLVRSVPS